MNTIISNLKNIPHQISNFFDARNTGGLRMTQIIKSSLGQFIGTTILIAFLLFFLNGMTLLSLTAKNTISDIKGKLWFYFYINDDITKKDETYTKVLQLKEKLEQQNIAVTFSSKEDWLRFLQKRVPEILKNFQRYGIENPLPATLYVTVPNQKTYNIMKDIIIQYRDIIMNVTELNDGKTIREQEARVLNTISLMNTINTISHILIGILLAIIVTLIIFLVTIKINHYHKQIEIEKSIGAPYRYIKKPFLQTIFLVLICALIISMIIFWFTTMIIDISLSALYNISLLWFIEQNKQEVAQMMTIYLGLLIIVAILTTNHILNRHIKKIG